MRMRRHHDCSNIELQTVLYDEYRTGCAFDSPMQSTIISYIMCIYSLGVASHWMGMVDIACIVYRVLSAVISGTTYRKGTVVVCGRKR